MSIKSKDELKALWVSGYAPTQTDFADLFDTTVVNAVGSGTAATITTGDAVSGYGGSVTVESATGDSSGGGISITAGYGATCAGSVNVVAGAGVVSGGAVNITAGDGYGVAAQSGYAGSVNITAGSNVSGSDLGMVGNITLTAGYSFSGGGEVSISGGSGNSGGDIALTAGYGSGVGGSVRITAGSENAGYSGGNVVISAPRSGYCSLSANGNNATFDLSGYGVKASGRTVDLQCSGFSATAYGASLTLDNGIFGISGTLSTQSGEASGTGYTGDIVASESVTIHVLNGIVTGIN